METEAVKTTELGDYESYALSVYGIPAPGGSKKAFVAHGRVIVKDDCKRNGDWRSLVAFTARQKFRGEPLAGALGVRVTFFMPRPKAHYRKNGDLKPNAPAHHTCKPDATKLWRSTE